MKKKFNSRGITILELTIGAVILGVIASLAIPQFGQTIQKLKLKNAGRDVVSAMRLARSNAVSQRDQFGVYFDYETNQFLIFKDVVNLTSFSYDPGQDLVVRTQELPGHVQFGYVNFPGFCVVFRPNGAASSSGYTSLYSYNEEHYYGSMSVDVLSSTGRVKLISGDYYGED